MSANQNESVMSCIRLLVIRIRSLSCCIDSKVTSACLTAYRSMASRLVLTEGVTTHEHASAATIRRISLCTPRLQCLLVLMILLPPQFPH